MIDQFDNTTKLPPFINTNDPEFLITDAGTPKIDGNKIHIEALAHQVTFIPPPSAKTQEFCSDLEPRDYPATYALNERVEAELNLRTHGDGNAPVRPGSPRDSPLSTWKTHRRHLQIPWSFPWKAPHQNAP